MEYIKAKPTKEERINAELERISVYFDEIEEFVDRFGDDFDVFLSIRHIKVPVHWIFSR